VADTGGKPMTSIESILYILRLITRYKCLTAFGLRIVRLRRFHKVSLGGLAAIFFDRDGLERCYNDLKQMLGNTNNEFCRIAIMAMMDFVARTHGGALLSRHRESLPRWLGLKDRSGKLKIDCRDKKLCYSPYMCLKAYLHCKEGWMRKELEDIVKHAGPPFAEPARLLLGEGSIPQWCGKLPESCIMIMRCTNNDK
jgi:hypothetical protein